MTLEHEGNDFNPDGETSPIELPGQRVVGHIGGELAKNPEELFSNPRKLKESHPSVYKTIVEIQGAGKSIRANWDAHRGVVLMIGSAVALGAVSGFAIKEFKRKRNKK